MTGGTGREPRFTIYGPTWAAARSACAAVEILTGSLPLDSRATVGAALLCDLGALYAAEGQTPPAWLGLLRARTSARAARGLGFVCGSANMMLLAGRFGLRD